MTRPAAQLAREVLLAQVRAAASERGYLVNRDIAYKEVFRRARAVEDSALAQLAPLVRQLGPQVVTRLDDVRERSNEWHVEQERLLLGDPGYAPEFLRRLPFQTVLYERTLAAGERLEEAIEASEAAALQRIRMLETTTARTMSAMIALASLAGLVLIVLVLRAVALTRRPRRRQVREAKERFRRLAENIEEVFWIRDAETGRYLYISPSYECIWGRGRSFLDAGLDDLASTVHEADSGAFQEAAATAASHALAASSGGKPGRWLRRFRRRASQPGETLPDEARPVELEYRIVRPDGAVRWIRERSYPWARGRGREPRVFGIAEDISDRVEAREHLAHLALHDPLTGLGNHVLFLDRLDHAVARARRDGGRVAVLVVDLREFDAISETLGQTDADILLRSVAARLDGCTRTEDTAVRVGGARFAILLERVQRRAEATRALERVAAALEASFEIGGRDVRVEARVAAVSSKAGDLAAVDLGRLADAAIGRIKAGAAPDVVVFEDEDLDRPTVDVGADSRLRDALERGEFRLRYQPVLRLATGELLGFEALLRWRHPERGVLEPAEFLPLAERSGLIHPLGLWALRQVCHDLGTWDELVGGRHDRWVSVNLSRRQFELPEFGQRISQILDRTVARAAALRVEVKEHTWIRERDELRRLRELGIKIVVDDFCKHYGAFGALSRLPVDALKIDRSLVANLPEREIETAVISSVVGMARPIGLDVTAVGVETEAQAQTLRALGCEAGQGFLFYEPLGDGDVKELLGGVEQAERQTGTLH